MKFKQLSYLSLCLLFSSLNGQHHSHINALIKQDAFFDENRFAVTQFLEQIARKENDLLNIDFLEQNNLSEKNMVNILNILRKTICESDDLNSIELYHRAIRNFNSLSNFSTQPAAVYYKHYQAPSFLIPKIDLILEVEKEYVKVITKLKIQRNSQAKDLILDGKNQNVLGVWVNGKQLERQEYYVTPHELIICAFNDSFENSIEIHSQIDPFHNHSLEGMYLSQNWLTTQCESEGARRIFFTLDRPDVLSQVTTTIIADKATYPYRLSNGNLIEETSQANGKTRIVWDDPFPKPSYLFACVLGDFSCLTSHFITRSGMDVELQVYVEKGKESRARYSLEALKKAMEFDEIFFDREYDLSCLKMVGIPDFNSGAMENKGLMIFNDTLLLVDEKSGIDAAYRAVAKVVAHEYFHNWSGNRVTVRNWFEIALKEAFTDWRANRFGEWLFGEEFVRPRDIAVLKEVQFLEEYSSSGHPLIVESYVDAHSIYDSTTYTKGREVFRTFEIYVNSLVPDGFREVLNLYFAENDGKAVTFKELLKAADTVLARVGKNSSQFERWFFQPGTPTVEIQMNYLDEQEKVEFLVKQSCKHPQTNEFQAPFIIPFSIELLGDSGVILSKEQMVLDEEETKFIFSVKEHPTPIFMHGLSAPVNLNFDYSVEDLKRIMKFTEDAYTRLDAGQKYAFKILKKIVRFLQDQTRQLTALQRQTHDESDFLIYNEILEDVKLSPLSKVQLTQIPTIRALSQELNEFDFPLLAKALKIFTQKFVHVTQKNLEKTFVKLLVSVPFAPTSEQMQIRELRNKCLALLAAIDENQIDRLKDYYFKADNFNDKLVAFRASLKFSKKDDEIKDHFYHQWKEDKAVFNQWLAAQAGLSTCSVEDLKKIEKIEGFDNKNPNHVRSLYCTFIANLGRYHDSQGLGYQFIVDKIIETSQFNLMLSHNSLAQMAFKDYANLPPRQKELMRLELRRLIDEKCAPQTKHLVKKILKID